MKRPLKEIARAAATSSLENRSSTESNVKNNFYSSFNFKVMHSRSKDFIDDELKPVVSIQSKQFGGVHRAGGS